LKPAGNLSLFGGSPAEIEDFDDFPFANVAVLAEPDSAQLESRADFLKPFGSDAVFR
jgi:hypothetical protein